ncbi:NAD(P)/FAD-dependent oxidoreductase [Vreelandella nanhaiensis]|nr:NAD(P)/FAD-dependent oxidoreductase [Halomonas nanhaiensis]
MSDMHSMEGEQAMMYDVAIVGGSYAGMAAGLQLAQTRRNVVVIDAGQPRNRFASHSRGFLTQDGKSPHDIAGAGYAELAQYPSVDWYKGKVETIVGEVDDFTLTLADSAAAPLHARRVILAAGVGDELPSLSGLDERWGTYVFHCPYCHGFDLNRGRIGVLATSEAAMHLALLLPDWGQTTLFLNDAFEPDKEQLEKLAKRGTHVERGPVERLTGNSVEVVMADSRVFPLDGLFVVTQTAPSALAIRLGCELDVTPLGRVIKTNDAKATSVPGVFACGDIARPVGNLSLAVSDGVLAGQAAHHSLVFDL